MVDHWLETTDGALPSVCRITPSTGQGSGVNVRREPNLDASVIDWIALDEYRLLTGLGDEWVRVPAQGGRAGYVKRSFVAFVGPCGGVPRMTNSP